MESTEMKGAFKCTKYCDDQVLNAFSPSTDGTKCIYSTEGNVSTCAAYHNLMQRFCPCDSGSTNPDTTSVTKASIETTVFLPSVTALRSSVSETQSPAFGSPFTCLSIIYSSNAWAILRSNFNAALFVFSGYYIRQQCFQYGGYNIFE